APCTQALLLLGCAPGTAAGAKEPGKRFGKQHESVLPKRGSAVHGPGQRSRRADRARERGRAGEGVAWRLDLTGCFRLVRNTLPGPMPSESFAVRLLLGLHFRLGSRSQPGGVIP